MAQLDFPASPVDGQLFRPTATGILYQWNAAKGLWLAVPNAAQFTSTDFFAVRQTSQGVATSLTVLLADTVVSGNQRNYYNPATGVYTPPPGRYVLYGWWSGNNGSAAANNQTAIRKNGVAVPGTAVMATGAATFNGFTYAQVILDANGTDTFDLVGASAVASATLGGSVAFGAFPIGVIVPAVANTLQLWNEQVLAAPANTITVTIPPTPRLVRLAWGAVSAGAVNDTFFLQAMAGASPVTGAVYTNQSVIGAAAVAAAGLTNNNATGWGLSGGIVATGWAEFSWLPSGLQGGGFPLGTSQVFEIQTSAGRVVRSWGLYLDTATPPASGITGFRLSPQTNNLTAGSYLRAFVIP